MAYNELEELLKYVNLLVLPSTLWAVHVDPKYNFMVVLHLEVESLKINIDKAVLVTVNAANGCLETTLFVQNEIVKFASLESSIKSVSDLAQIIYFMHNLKLCINANDKVKYSQCIKYVELPNVEDVLCASCVLQGDINWKSLELEVCSATLNTIKTDDLNLLVNKSECLASTVLTVDNVNTVNLSNLKTSQYLCKFCDKMFYVEAEFQKHLDKAHSSNRFLCKICNKVSTNETAHEKHLLLHADSKMSLCNICGKTFGPGYRMKDHLLTHSSEKPFKCDTCNKCFTKSYNLKLHQKTHSGSRQFVCFDCGKSYTTQSNLTTHMKGSHTNSKPHKCTTCSMTFVHPRYLRIHMRKHTGEKPYKCIICSKLFSKNIHLTVHMRTHTGEKPHICSLCGKGFITTGNLNSHKKVHHKDVKNDEESSVIEPFFIIDNSTQNPLLTNL